MPSAPFHGVASGEIGLPPYNVPFVIVDGVYILVEQTLDLCVPLLARHETLIKNWARLLHQY